MPAGNALYDLVVALESCMKRCLDVLCASGLLLLVLPFLVVCALVIKLGSRGPVLFRQVRMGRNFRPFLVVKLRTMVHRGVGLPYTLGADPRITAAGRWMRKYKVDELPQLWNVLCGEMSMVGPRPVVPQIAEEFRAEYEQLLTVRPGLTDPATLKYHNECELLEKVPDPHRHFKQVVTPDKLRLSAQYLQEANLWRDMRLMARTAGALVPRFSGSLLRRAVVDSAEPAQPAMRSIWSHSFFNF